MLVVVLVETDFGGIAVLAVLRAAITLFVDMDFAGVVVIAVMRAAITGFVDADFLVPGGGWARGAAVVAVTAVVLFEDARLTGLTDFAARVLIPATVLAEVLLAAGVLTTVFAMRVSVASVVTFPSAARSGVELSVYLLGLLLLTLLGR